MSDKKNLKIEAMVCDCRSVTEEVLKQYESVTIEAMIVYGTEESLELLHRHHVKMEVMCVEKMEKDWEIIEKNGSCTIRSGQEIGDKVSLVVNGSLTVEKGAEEVLKNYMKIQVNGSVVYPEGLGGALAGKLSVNGHEQTYPDDAVFVDGDQKADRVFIARAQPDSLYYVTGAVYFTDMETDYGKLLEKRVKMMCGRAYVYESALDCAAAILDEKADIVLIPDGCTFVYGNSTAFDQSFPARYGTKAWVQGRLEVKDAGGLDKMEYLRVNGRATVREEDKEAFIRSCVQCGDLLAYRGALITGRTEYIIDGSMIEEAGDGLTVEDCVNVTVRDDVSKEQITEKLRLKDCVNVTCSEKQEGVIRLTNDGCININVGNNRTPEAEQDEDTLYIEAMKYVL